MTTARKIQARKIKLEINRLAGERNKLANKQTDRARLVPTAKKLASSQKLDKKFVAGATKLVGKKTDEI